MAARKDITPIVPGYKYWNLTVLEEAPKRGSVRQRRVVARCACGVVKDYALVQLRSGKTKSCGCMRARRIAEQSFVHGHGRRGKSTRTRQIWAGMLARCRNPNNSRYADYGGRGVKVCERWQEYKYFLEDMGEAPEKLTLDRYPNVNGDYEPSNCRWATMREQNNNRRDNYHFEYRGRFLTIRQLCDESGLPYATLKRRLVDFKWPIERAVSQEKREYAWEPLPLITYRGKTQSMADWGRELGIKYATLKVRLIKHKWPVDRAFETPIVVGAKRKIHF